MPNCMLVSETARFFTKHPDYIMNSSAETSRNSVKRNGGLLNAQSASHVVKTTENTSMGCDIQEAAKRCGNSREVSRPTRVLSAWHTTHRGCLDGLIQHDGSNHFYNVAPNKYE